jgi:transposase-like protein
VSKKVEPKQTEVVPKATRRTFTADYKRDILEQIAACQKPGEIGAILRREGLYSSIVSKWRGVAEQQTLAALAPKKRGPKTDPLEVEIAKLRRHNAQLQARAERAELLVEIQKKLSTILDLELPKMDEGY